MVAGIPAAAKPLLRPHLEDLDAKLKPGAFVLTWVSLNIDGYLHNLHQASRGSGTICWLLRAMCLASDPKRQFCWLGMQNCRYSAKAHSAPRLMH